MMPTGTDGHDEPAGLGGLFVDLVTPLRPDGSLDRHGLDALLLQVPPDRFAGVVTAGTAGEGPLLPLGVRAEITEVVTGDVPGFRHVLAVALATSPAAIVAELDVLAAAGASAALVSPLSYYEMGPGAVAGFFAEVVRLSPLPVVLYRSPALTGVEIPLPVVADLAGEETVVGIVDAGGDAGYLSWLVLHVQDRAGFGVLGGDDAGLMAAVLTGAAGAVSAGANLVPDLVAEVYGHSVTRSLHRARQAQRRLLSVVETCRGHGVAGGWKAAVSAAGLCGPTPALCGFDLGPDDARRLRAELAGLGVVSPPS